jgi:putative spermidine/putrescine transport system permease protein
LDHCVSTPARIRLADGILLVTPLAGVMIVVIAVPLGWEVWQSFMSPHLTGANYAELARHPAYLRSMLTTVRIAAVVTLICLPLAYLLAYVLTRLGGRTAAVLLALTILPFWISAVVRSFAWMLILQRNGVLNGWLLGIGLIDRPLSVFGTSTAVYIAMTSVLMPVMVLPMYNTMREIDEDCLKAAASLGASPWRSFREVFLPLSLPGVAAGGLLVFILSLGYFITPSMLGGAKNTMVAVLIYQQTQAFEWEIAFTLATVLLVVILTLYAFASLTVGVGRLLIGTHRA